MENKKISKLLTKSHDYTAEIQSFFFISLNNYDQW